MSYHATRDETEDERLMKVSKQLSKYIAMQVAYPLGDSFMYSQSFEGIRQFTPQQIVLSCYETRSEAENEGSMKVPKQLSSYIASW